MMFIIIIQLKIKKHIKFENSDIANFSNLGGVAFVSNAVGLSRTMDAKK